MENHDQVFKHYNQSDSSKPDIQSEDFEDDEDDDIQIVGQLDDSPPLNHKQSMKQIKQRKVSSDSYKIIDNYSKQIRQLFKKSKFRELVELVQDDKSIYQEFQEVKYHGESYKINQNVMVNNANNQNDDYIAKIIKIIQIKESKTNKFILLSQVKWFYKKNEIVNILPQHKSWISSNELFTTNSTDYILTTAINSPCTILSIEEYERLDNIENSVFFTRLQWIPHKNKFIGLQNLKQHCLCKQPINPDQFYIQCDKCMEWYHMTCVGVRKGEWENKDYICGRCR